MKKILSILTLGLFLPLLVLGAVGYERTPAGYTINNPVSFAVTGVFEEYPSANSWRLRYNMIDGECATTTNALFEEILPLGNYWQVQLLYYSNDYCGYPNIGDLWFEYDGGNTIFEVVEEVGITPMFDMPDDFIVFSFLNFTDLVEALKIPLALIFGIILAMWIVPWVLNLRGGHILKGR